ncbi:ribosome maturation factor RimM [Virgibacillus phasianinus]|uniref:ribosome maturation factor RimM n=1 Tax=Virgibacillus phasianinus TaxID=2017483 RepID=UPI0026A13824
MGEALFLVIENKHPLKLEVASHRTHKGFDLLSFKGFDSINEVEGFKGCYLKISENQLTELEEGAYYYHEIINCDVFLNTGEQLGVVKEILSPGANDVWVINRKKGKDILIPYIDDVVKEIDVDAKKVIINPIEGLLE